MRTLTQDDVAHLLTGALFLACSADHVQAHDYARRVIDTMERTGREPVLCRVDELDDDAQAISVGFVMKGLSISELTPVGDEFSRSVRMLEDAAGREFDAYYPLAAANINVLVPLLLALETGRPVLDVDPMGRVFPLLSQTTLAAVGEPIGPLAVTGPTGESALVEVESAYRAERIVRALAAEFGGWAATASYPASVATLARSGVVGSVSRLIRIGGILSGDDFSGGGSRAEKHRALAEEVGVRRVIRARVTDVEGLVRPPAPGQPDLPTSVTLLDEARNRVVRLEIQNEILMMMVDGAVEAVMPDVITMLRAEDDQVASIEDLWVGNRIDLLSLPASDAWYTPEGLALAGEQAFGISLGVGRRR